MGLQQIFNPNAISDKAGRNATKSGKPFIKPGMQATAQQKIDAVGGVVIELPKLLPASVDDISLATEMSPISMTETAAGSGIFNGSVGGNGFVFIPVGDTQISDIVNIEVTYTSLGGNEKTDSVPSQQIVIGKPYTFVSKVLGKWAVKITSASKAVKGAQLTGV